MNRVYTIEFTHQRAPGEVSAPIFYINNSNREFFLKSIFFDIRIVNPVTDKPLPLEQNNTQMFRLNISTIPVTSLIASAFSDFTGAGATVTRNGQEIVLFRPGQYFWNAFFIKDVLQFYFSYYNSDAAISYEYRATVVTEIEDKKIKFAA